MAQEEGKVSVKLRFLNGEKIVYCGGEYFLKVLHDRIYFFPCSHCKYFLREEKELGLVGIGGYVGGYVFKPEERGVKHLESITFKCLKFNLKKTINF